MKVYEIIRLFFNFFYKVGLYSINKSHTEIQQQKEEVLIARTSLFKFLHKYISDSIKIIIQVDVNNQLYFYERHSFLVQSIYCNHKRLIPRGFFCNI